MAASPLMITTGLYWLIASSRSGRLVGQDRRQEAEVAGYWDQICAGESSQEARQSQPSHAATLSGIESGKAEQDQQTVKREKGVRGD